MFHAVATKDTKRALLFQNRSVLACFVTRGAIYHMRDGMGGHQRCARWYQIGC